MHPPGTEDDVIEISSDEGDFACSTPRAAVHCRSGSPKDSVISLTSDSEDEDAPSAQASVKEERRAPSVIVISDSESELASSHKENADPPSPDGAPPSSHARTSVVVVSKHGRLALQSVPSTPGGVHIHCATNAADAPDIPTIMHTVGIGLTFPNAGRAGAAATEDDPFDDDGAGSDWEVPSVESMSPRLLVGEEFLWPGIFSYEVYPCAREPSDGPLQRFNIHGHWQVKIAIYFRVSVRVAL